MFNRQYQIRATRQGIRSFLAQEFYRPARRPDPRLIKSLVIAKGEQLRLNFDADKPLKDIFPTAYGGNAS